MGPYGLCVTCTCGTVLHLHLTCGTRRLACHLTLAIHHKSLRSVLSPSDVYLWDPSPSDLWDPMAYVSRVTVGPFSISIQPVEPDGLRVTCTMCAVGVQFLKKGWIPRSRTRDLDLGMGRFTIALDAWLS